LDLWKENQIRGWGGRLKISSMETDRRGYIEREEG